MIIDLPVELESSVRSLVHAGRFASEAELVAEAVRAFLHRPDLMPSAGSAPGPLGVRADAADELDEVVEHAMNAGEGRKPIWERVLEITAEVPDEEWDK